VTDSFSALFLIPDNDALNPMANTHRVVTFLMILGCSLYFSSCGSKANDAPPERTGGRTAGMTVSGVVLTLQPLDNVVNSSGSVLASESVDLAAEASGIVQTIAFKEGTHVGRTICC